MALQGMEGLQRALRTMPDVVRQELRQVVGVTAFALANRIRATAPRDTGLLRGAVSSRVTGLTGRVELGVDAFYWHFVEYGTVRMAARPFVRPAGELEAADFERRLKDLSRTIEHRWEQAA